MEWKVIRDSLCGEEIQDVAMKEEESFKIGDRDSIYDVTYGRDKNWLEMIPRLWK